MKLRVAGVVGCSLLVVAVVAMAGEGEAEPSGAMDMETAMQKMQELAAPGEHHEHLGKLVGSWTYTAKFFMPGAPEPMESSGSMEAKPILGGRFVQADWQGDFLGMPFHGIGLDGYDKMRHVYTSSWIDNFGTMTMHYTGNCDGTGKVRTLTSEFMDPMSGAMVKSKNVSTWVDADTMKMESYRIMPDGSEMKEMEIVAKRKG